MTPERWQKVGELYQAVLECPPDERAQFLKETCDGDEELHREIEALLAAEDSAGSFMSGDAIEDAARLLAQEKAGALVGQAIGHYRVLNLLGQGGMGEVYLAEDTRLKRKVALKLLPAYFMISRDRVNRFEQEARAISSLNHPNIVTIHEIGQFNDVNFIVTEFIDGQTLREIMSEKRIDVLEALDLSVQIANALSAAHAAGIIHRDIKPENIMVRSDGYVKVLDFGLAKLAEGEAVNLAEAPTKIVARTQPGLVMGSTNYMSPEQARADHVDERTDVWSLGVVLYEMLTGRAPFEGETSSHVIVSILEEEPPLLSEYLVRAPEELQRIITKALRKNRKERYETVSDISFDLKTLKHDLDRAGNNGIRVSARDAPAIRTLATKVRRTSSVEYLVNEIKRHKAVATWLAAVILLLVAAIGYWFFWRGSTETGAIDSVAVLPFVNVDNDPNKEYLSEGISDSIINSLSQLPGLKVKSLNSVLRYKKKETDPQAVGRELKVGAVLIGRLTQHGDDLLISAELVDVRDNRRLWGEQYNRKLSDILMVQNQIAREIAGKLRLRLTSEQQKQLAKNNTQNTEAYQLYSMGMHLVRKNTKEGFDKGIDYFWQALKIDPNYELAYRGLYGSYYWLGSRGYWFPNEARQKMEWAALKLVELNDSSATAHAVLGQAKKTNWDWAGAEKEFARALELDPDDYGSKGLYSIFLMDVGRLDEALVYAKLFVEERQKRPPEEDREGERVPQEAFVYLYRHEYDKAIELFKANQRNPNRGSFQLAEAYLGRGMYAEAVVEMEKYLAVQNDPQRWESYPIMAYAYAAAGRRDEALKILREQEEAAKRGYISPFNFAIIYTGLGDKNRAFEYLGKAVDEHVPILYHFPGRPLFDALHSDPRYAHLLRKMNLPPERFLKS